MVSANTKSGDRLNDHPGGFVQASCDPNRRTALTRILAISGLCAGLGGCGAAPGQQLGASLALQAERPNAIAFYGLHQAGVTTPRPSDGLVASFSVEASEPEALEALLRELSALCAGLMAGQTPAAQAERVGLLGQVFDPQALTMTVSLGSSLFDQRSWLQPFKPRQLQPMMAFPNDQLEPVLCHGDLSVQICANQADVVAHALRVLVHQMAAHMAPLWLQQGQVPPPEFDAQGRQRSGRNALGFRDGSANPDAHNAALMDRVVWIGAHNHEPEWARAGSYQVVRIIRNQVLQWDYLPVDLQETIIGRAKPTGAPLDQRQASEFDTPVFEADPQGVHTSLDSHIRRSNPRTPGSEVNLMLRRPFNYDNGLSATAELDQGLLFICYQADLQRAFIEVQTRLNGEPMEAFVKPVGGGFFLTLPGAKQEGDYLGQTLIQAYWSAAGEPHRARLS